MAFRLGLGIYEQWQKYERYRFLASDQERTTDRGFDYYFGIPASLDISPYVYVENNKATSIPDHVIEPQKKNLALLMHGGMAGADFKPEECFPNIIRHSLNYINEQKDSKKPFFFIFAYNKQGDTTIEI